MTSLPNEARTEPYLTMPTSTLVSLLLSVQASGRLPRDDGRKRVPVSEVRAELRRREVAGWDDPFHPIHDPVTP
jgi:hypothetical protein